MNSVAHVTIYSSLFEYTVMETALKQCFSMKASSLQKLIMHLYGVVALYQII